jgi:DMSO/TMAO reductase YedYZ heme-binding membrane subunit
MFTPQIKLPPSDKVLYFRTLLFSSVLFGLFFAYTSWMKIPNVMNKTVADVSIVLIGLSMILSGVCYFWNRFDSLIVYRKHLGLSGWAFGIAHMILSKGALLGLFTAEIWQKGAAWPAFNGLVAMVIFTVMAAVSNTKMARLLGGKVWRGILRTGYVAIIFVLIHVVLLKSGRWATWFQEGMQTPPSLSLMVTIFMVIVLLMRVALWIALILKKRTTIPQ